MGAYGKRGSIKDGYLRLESGKRRTAPGRCEPSGYGGWKTDRYIFVAYG